MEDFGWLFNTSFTPGEDGRDHWGHTKEEDDAIRADAMGRWYAESKNLPKYDVWNFFDNPIGTLQGDINPETKEYNDAFGYGKNLYEKYKNNNYTVDDELQDIWQEYANKKNEEQPGSVMGSGIGTQNNGDRYRPSVNDSMGAYWDEANKQAVNNAVASGKLDSKDAYNNDDSGDINWGRLNEINFFKNEDGSNKNIYKDNGVTYKSVMDTMTNPDDIHNITNERALRSFGPGRTGNVQDFWTRDTRNGETITDTDRQLVQAQLQGIDFLKDTNPQLYNELQNEMVDTSGGRKLRGQDLFDMEEGYDADTGAAYGDRYNGMTAEQIARSKVDNPVNAETLIDEGDLGKIFELSGNDLEGLNDMTDKLTRGGLALKNPNGQRDEIVMGNNEEATPLQLAQYAAEAAEKGGITADQAKNIIGQTQYLKNLNNAQLNAAIIASAAANGNKALQASDNAEGNQAKLDLINNFMQGKDWNDNTFFGADKPDFEYTLENPDTEFNVGNLSKVHTLNSPGKAELKNDTNGRGGNWTNSDNLFTDDIEKALSRIGLKRRR